MGAYMWVYLAILLSAQALTEAAQCGAITDCDDTNGECVNDICFCKANFMGTECKDTCSTAACTAPEVCTGNIAGNCAACSPECDATGGSCATVNNEAKCKCNLGYYGDGCADEYCPANKCKNSGVCSPTDGTCTCTNDWTGPTCELECTGGCTDLQQCMDNTRAPSCQCKTGLSGTDCTTIACNADGKAPCENAGTCADDACTCTKNFSGTICELECTPACGDNEQCEVVDSNPQCNHGVTAMVTPALITSLLLILGFL